MYNDDEGGVKDTFANVFDVSDKILVGKNKTLFGNQLLKDIKRTTGALGDYQLLNNSLFQNYSDVSYYFDDNMEKTAFFLDTISRCEL